jgi:hypothetical protein
MTKIHLHPRPLTALAPVNATGPHFDVISVQGTKCNAIQHLFAGKRK